MRHPCVHFAVPCARRAASRGSPHKHPETEFLVQVERAGWDSTTLACLQDLEDTTGSWELYGQEDERRYPSLQAEFFNRAAAPLTRRSSILAFTFVGACQPIA